MGSKSTRASDLQMMGTVVVAAAADDDDGSHTCVGEEMVGLKLWKTVIQEQAPDADTGCKSRIAA